MKLGVNAPTATTAAVRKEILETAYQLEWACTSTAHQLAQKPRLGVISFGKPSHQKEKQSTQFTSLNYFTNDIGCQHCAYEGTMTRVHAGNEI